VRPIGQGIEQCPADPRLADAGFCHQQHALALARLGLRPALEQQRQLLVAAHHRQQRGAGARLEAAQGRPLAEP
jgi:hypothetical protein